MHLWIGSETVIGAAYVPSVLPRTQTVTTTEPEADCPCARQHVFNPRRGRIALRPSESLSTFRDAYQRLTRGVSWAE